MLTENLSKELISVFTYIKDVLCVEKPKAVINEYGFVLAVLNNENSSAYKSLSSIVLDDTLEKMKEFYEMQITYEMNTEDNDKSHYSIFDSYIKECSAIRSKFGMNDITSSILLLSILKTHEEISRQFRDFSITSNQLENYITQQIQENSTSLIQLPKKHTKKKKKNELMEIAKPVKIIEKTPQSDNAVERNLVNISKIAALGDIPTVINYDKYYTEIFTILSKKDRNNVIVCGKHGVGKTATVKNLANIINAKQCNNNFHNKILVELDFSKLVIGTPFKGAFEQKFYSILEDAKLYGNYIFFIDNLGSVLNSNTKYAETDIESILLSLFTEPSVRTICTMQPKGYGNIKKNCPSLAKCVQKVMIEEPTEDEAFEILNATKSQYETYHDVTYTDEALKESIKLSKKYITSSALPYAALDLLDMTGAKANINIEENEEIKELKNKLNSVISNIEEIKTSSETKEYDKIDELVKEQIEIKSKIGMLEKENILSKEPTIIDRNEICSIVSQKLDIPLDDITQSEKTKLKDLNAKLKESIIGQDEAVEEVCRVVKRQRIGLGDNERPAVLMFLGSTGVGKTYLAKQLAKEVFGDDKHFVRMDMSEYADKTSINKICGSGNGYVGYDDDTFLVSALKKYKHFVLLLDEFEKSNEEVHNVFLQMFDEGRFTDNHGTEYSLKDVIIIMTSNVGVAEANNRGNAIGFGNGGYDMSRDIIEKELKHKFKPEFLNRIQKIIYFNKLENDNLKSIIKLEVSKLNKKIEKLGYHFSTDITEGKMVDEIYETIIKTKEYGARPIVNEVQRRIEDTLVDYIIDNEVEEGHTFTYNEIVKE